MASKTITIIGSLNMDLVTTTPRIPSGGETLTASSFSTGPGGKGANQAVACARLSRPSASRGSPRLFSYAFAKTEDYGKGEASIQESDITVQMLGAIGADEFGPELISSLRSSGVETSEIQSVKGTNTGVAVILVEEDTGENRILLSPGANHTMTPSQFLTPSSLGSPIPSLILLQLEIPLPTVLQIISTAKAAHVPILLNPAPAVPLPASVFMDLDHLIVNESEAAILTGRKVEEVSVLGYSWAEVLEEFIFKGVKNVVITLGANGVVFASKDGEKGFAPAEKVERVVDTTAAGDTFVGAYAVEVVRGKKSKEEILRWACMAAARTVERKGAQSAIPWADEVEKIPS